MPRAPPTRNWLLSPDHSSLSPRRVLFPRKLNLFFSPKRSSPSPPHPRYAPSPTSPNARRHSVSLDSLYSINTPPRSTTRRKSIPGYSATHPKLLHCHHTTHGHSPREHLLNCAPRAPSSRIRHSLRNASSIKCSSTSISPGKPSSTTSSPFKFASPSNSIIFCSPMLSPTWNPSSPLPPRPNHPSPRRFSSRPARPNSAPTAPKT